MHDKLPLWVSLAKEACSVLQVGSKERRRFLGRLDREVLRSKRRKYGELSTVYTSPFQASTKDGLIKHLLRLHLAPSMMAAFGVEFGDIDTFFIKGFPLDELAEMLVGILRDEPQEFSPIEPKIQRPSEAVHDLAESWKERKVGVTYSLEQYYQDVLALLKYIVFLDSSAVNLENIPQEFHRKFEQTDLSHYSQEGRKALIGDPGLAKNPNMVRIMRRTRNRLLRKLLG